MISKAHTCPGQIFAARQKTNCEPQQKPSQPRKLRNVAEPTSEHAGPLQERQHPRRRTALNLSDARGEGRRSEQHQATAIRNTAITASMIQKWLRNSHDQSIRPPKARKHTPREVIPTNANQHSHTRAPGRGGTGMPRPQSPIPRRQATRGGARQHQPREDEGHQTKQR